MIFDYPLKQFRLDGYSKEIKVLEADLPPFDRALQAVLLSQYRRKIFEKNHIQMKPVVMFKSKTIKDSQAFYQEFIEGIKGLKSETLQAIRNKSSDENILKIFQVEGEPNWGERLIVVTKKKEILAQLGCRS